MKIIKLKKPKKSNFGFKRGDKVVIRSMEGIVINTIHRTEDEDGYEEKGVRISIKDPKLKLSWWTYLPLEVVRRAK